MFLPEVSEDNFHTYYNGTYAIVHYGGGNKLYGRYHGGNTWVSMSGDRHELSRNNITSIEVPSLGYYELNGVPLFASRIPARTTHKGLCQANSICTLSPDVARITNQSEAQPWTAHMQPEFSDYTDVTIQEAVARIVNGDKPYVTLSPSLQMCLNATDGRKDVYANLYWRGFCVGKYDKKGQYVTGNPNMLKVVA